MGNEGRTVRYTANELRAMASRTDWSRVDAITEEELERLIADDPYEAGFEGAVWIASSQMGNLLAGVEPELLASLPPAGPLRDAEVSRIVRNHLKRKAARARRAG